MPRGICVALRQRHLDALRLRFKGMTYLRAAEEAGISMDPFIVRLEQVRTRMERSNAIMLRAFSIKRGLTDEFFEFARGLGEVYSQTIKYGDLDAFYWLAQLMSRLAERRYPERGAPDLPFRPEEEELVEAHNSGVKVATYARSAGINPNKLQMWLIRYRAKLADAAANFVLLDGVAPKPHSPAIVRKLRPHAEEFFAWAREPSEQDPAHLIGGTLNALWVQEVGMRSLQTRVHLVEWLRGRRASIKPAELIDREELEIPVSIQKAISWK